MTKAEIRTLYKQKRQQLRPEEILHGSAQIANALLKLPIWEKQNFHVFLTISRLNEIDTEQILPILFGKEKNIIVSKVLNSNDLTHFLLTENTPITQNTWGIPEPISGQEIPPTAIDVVFVPLLAFDFQGNRLGYGKGFYDKFLRQCRPDVIKIGLSLFPAETQILPTTPGDVPLNYCVTPQKTYTF